MVIAAIAVAAAAEGEKERSRRPRRTEAEMSSRLPRLYFPLCRFVHGHGRLQSARWLRSVSNQPSLSEKNQKLGEAILAGDRASLARAITLMESSRADHRAQADLLQDYLLRHRKLKASGWNSSTFRIGIAGPPGAGIFIF